MSRKLFSVLLAIVMALGMLPTAAFAEGKMEASSSITAFSDMPDNWSTAALQNAIENGLLVGANGMIMPNDTLTRAQMAAVIVRVFGTTVKADLKKFSDIKDTDWYADSMAKAYQMGVIKGADGRLNPKEPISREQVFLILSRALKLKPANTVNQKFSDDDEISDWATGEVYALVNTGFIQGGGNEKLNPKGHMTRAQFAQVMYNIFTQYIIAAGEYTAVAEGTVIINVPGVTLKNVTVKGDLVIGDGVGNGNVWLDSVVVTGRTVIRGGGVNSIRIIGN